PRGPYPTMYRGRTWTMRQIAGFGTGEDTNRRFRDLIEQGETGLSVDFHMPTLMGYDSDDPLSEGEVGREGVAIDTLDDMRALFDGIDLEKISVSMTINPTAWILLAMYVALAQERGYDLNNLSATVQADILKEYQAQKEWIFPIRPSMRIVRDLIVYSARNLARYNPINISGYHISEAGANAVQELAFTMCNAVAYLQEVTQAGVPVDEFAPRLAFYFVAQQDFFEEIAKFRAARRCWAKIALRTQQIIADETRVAQVSDPLGGSWYVESLTKRIEDEVFAILDKVETMGGTVRAVEQGYFQKEIAETAYRSARKKASGENPVIGVNKFVDPPKQEQIEIHKIDPEVEHRQIARTKDVRRKRDAARFDALLDRLEKEARDPEANLMPVTIDLVKAGVSMGEVVSRL